MMRLDDREWKPIPIVSLFDRFEPGKGKGLNHLEQTEHGISYIGATNRNNGVLCFVKDTDVSRKMMQEGNCIGFIKNGDGSAGYAIYKQEPFVSTSDVIYGYATWLNSYTGLFFVAAQDMIEHKYSHGYKRNAQHLKGDRVMLPVTDAGEPDYQFMEDYMRELMDEKKRQYRGYVKQRIAELCAVPGDQQVDWKSMIDSREWQSFIIKDIADVYSGHDIYAQERIDGLTPLVTAVGVNNGVGYFVGNDNDSRAEGSISVVRNGASVGKAFYHKYSALYGNDCRRMKLKDTDSEFASLFITQVIRMQNKSFSYSRKLGTGRLENLKIMLPVTSAGQPDYDFMESFGRKMMSNKYSQYLSFLALPATTI